ncbi:hypothetical protein EW145_g480 [Phellinidium pouzarii]|uniref:Uncharacterized protein n=1 Tax=Phellinidium pouzarii TaxID=167371 RepID=A0A4S4LK44_9AGAM|nr:hypothetical protein EW145_g480 [Phellinidium pouzarii]
MSATVVDPFLLASYPFPSDKKTSTRKPVVSNDYPHIFASHSAVPKREDGQVTLAVHGDGIHVFDLADLHPVSSHTLGPSTRFASAPATLVTSEDGKSFRRTYVAIQEAQDIGAQDAGKVIWSWKEEINGEIGSSQDKNSCILAHDAAYILVPQNLNSVITVSRNGRLTFADLDLNMLKSWSPNIDAHTITNLFAFPRLDCSFISAGVPPIGTVLIVFTTQGKELFVQIIALGREGEIVALSPQTIPVESSENVIDISCDASGHLSILESSGLWSPFRVDIRDGGMMISSTSKPLHLKGLHFIKSKSRDGHVSLLSLGSSYVLLAGLTVSLEIYLLLWDIQFGVLLHSLEVPFPSTLQKTPLISVSLVKGNSTQVLLVLSPRNHEIGRLRSSVLVVPFTVPQSSTIASAMGRAVKSAPWLISDRQAMVTDDVGTSPFETKEKQRLLTNLQDAVEEERIEDAENLFFSWANRKDEKVKGKTTLPSAMDDGEIELFSAEVGGPSPSKSHEAKKLPARRTFDHAFVTRVLQIILHPENLSAKSYSHKICRYLLSRNLISNSMVDGGLLNALTQRNDWETIRECFSHVIDIPESESLHALHTVIKLERARSAPDEDAMAINQPKGQGHHSQQKSPSINSFLACVIEYPASQLAWRKALRDYFADIDYLMALLVVLDGWLQVHEAKGLSLELGEVSINEHGVPVAKSNSVPRKVIRTKGEGLLPALENILSFLQAILDSSFLILLQNPQAHVLLQRLATDITPHAAVSDVLESLRGPLAPFAKAQSKALADVRAGKRKDEVDWRKRRKQTQEQTAINLGPYQVEELVF